MFDTMIIGQVCMDTNVDYDGRTEHRYGGAVLYSGHMADVLSDRVAIVTKDTAEPQSGDCGVDVAQAFSDCSHITIHNCETAGNTVMENVYFTPDRERRRSRCTGIIDPYTEADLPEEPAQVYHLAGLVTGDIDEKMLEACARRGRVALDVQCMMRRVLEDKTLQLFDWPGKKEYLPLVDMLKTDAAEAEMLTGTADREKAAVMLHGWGAKEVLITHNSEAIAYDGTEIYKAPLLARNLSGRTGRGDTFFAAYIAERRNKGIKEALQYAAAAVSLKMETPGPFTGMREDIDVFIRNYYLPKAGL